MPGTFKTRFTKLPANNLVIHDMFQPESIYNTSVLSGTSYAGDGGVNGWDLKSKGISSSRETRIQETGSELKGREPLVVGREPLVVGRKPLVVGMAQRLSWCLEPMGQRRQRAHIFWVFEKFWIFWSYNVKIVDFSHNSKYFNCLPKVVSCYVANLLRLSILCDWFSTIFSS